MRCISWAKLTHKAKYCLPRHRTVTVFSIFLHFHLSFLLCRRAHGTNYSIAHRRIITDQNKDIATPPPIDICQNKDEYQ